MNLSTLEALVRELNSGGVRYLIVGGLAVGAHGYPRLTMDVDLVVRATSVDVFVTEPFDFDEEYARALLEERAFGIPVRFVGLPTLIRMKEVAGRARDLDDLEHLRWIQKQSDEQ